MQNRRRRSGIERGVRQGQTRWLTIPLLTAAFLLAGIGLLHAHVSVSPGEVSKDTSQRFTVRVPSERPEATVKLRLEFPAALGNPRFLSKPGWTYELEKDAAGKTTAVTWSGGEIAADEFDEFVFTARTPAEPGTLTFLAHQTYASGLVISWAGPAGGNEPAPVVRVVDAAPADAAPSPSAESSEGTGEPEAGGSGRWMGALALALSVLALGVSLAGLKRRG
jgi:uncharacterized protein YcnI